MSDENNHHASSKSGAKSMKLAKRPDHSKMPLQMATYGLASEPTMSPAEAVQAILAREPSIPAAHPNVLSQNMVEGPFSIVELARSLQNNPDLIFEWVYNNIEYLPTFGEAKGGLGCLIDGMGNPFDQCELLFALLTQAGFSPSYVLGQIQINATQAAAWLGTSTSSLSYAYNIFNNGGIPVQYVNSNTQLQLTHIWIKVAISGTTYVFDPSFKQYTTTAPINIATATGYSVSAQFFL